MINPEVQHLGPSKLEFKVELEDRFDGYLVTTSEVGSSFKERNVVTMSFNFLSALMHYDTIIMNLLLTGQYAVINGDAPGKNRQATVIRSALLPWAFYNGDTSER